MTIIEQIKAEIERLKSIEYPCDNSQQATGFFNAIDRMTDFLDTLESEKPIGLEEEIHKYNKERFDEYFPEQDGDFISEVDFMTCLDRVARHFAKLGAEDAREKMMVEAVEGEIFDDYDKDICEHRLTILSTVPPGYKDGDKVRVIIVKEDEK